MEDLRELEDSDEELEEELDDSDLQDSESELEGEFEISDGELEDSDPNVRQAAVAALGKSPEAVKQHGDVIVQRLEHWNGSVL